MKNVIIRITDYILIAGIILALFLILTSSKPSEPVSPKARIIFYPANGMQGKSWISGDIPTVENGSTCFKTQQGNKVCVSGSFTVEFL